MSFNSPSWHPSQMQVDMSGAAFRIHRRAAIAWGVVLALYAWTSFLADGRPGRVRDFSLGYMLAVVVVVHVLLAIGAKRRMQAARVPSMIVGGLMMLIFPLGTFVGYQLIQSARSPWHRPSRPAD